MSLIYAEYLNGISPGYVAELWPPVFERGSGKWLYDCDGGQYLDLDAGWGAMVLGHAHPEVTQATIQALEKLEHATPPTFPMVELMGRLTEILAPWDLNKFMFGVSGSEAVEHALEMAVLKSGGKRKVLVLDRCYHGSAIGLLPISFPTSGLAALSGVIPVPAPTPFCYRCPFNLTVQNCQRECVSALRSLVAKDKDELAGVLIEPVLGKEGIPLPEGYLSAVGSICAEFRIPLIIDEVKTGIGRCGAIFASEMEDVQPDIMIMGKALSNGFPLSVAVFKESACPPEFVSMGVVLQTTFSGHAVACARAVKTLDVARRKKLHENAAVMGKALIEALRDLLKSDNSVGDIRGAGMLIGVEFVADRETKRLSTSALTRFVSSCRRAGLHVATIFRNTLTLTPPLILDMGDIDEMMDRLKKELQL
ncbi:MAG: aspartate aminotransferase family protein [Nitrospinae bacterium]|nr:aspartate aminotransferase family protein [Nitrospinota bacterium]